MNFPVTQKKLFYNIKTVFLFFFMSLLETRRKQNITILFGWDDGDGRRIIINSGAVLVKEKKEWRIHQKIGAFATEIGAKIIEGKFRSVASFPGSETGDILNNSTN